MKVAVVSYSDTVGGSARAAYRIHSALRGYGVDSCMEVADAATGDWTVHTLSGQWKNRLGKLRHPLARLLTNVLQTTNPSLHSPNLFPSRWPEALNRSDADVLHLHLMAQEMMSISDIGKLRRPVVWTLHDMWGFCGAEHFTEDFRWRDGYTRQNRPAYESRFDLNRWTWQRKLKHWRRPMHIVTPSRWLADCVRQSALMHDWPVTVVPNAIDTEVYRPVDKVLARKLLGICESGPVLLFGATGGTADPRKGFDLLEAALNRLRGEFTRLQLVVLGEQSPQIPLNLGFPIHYSGHLHDDIGLRLYYSAADAVVVPSRQETFSLVSGESQACGTPVVAFDATALPGVVEHQKTGYLAKAFDAEDLARGIRWILGDVERARLLNAQSRQCAVEKYSYPVVAEQYLKVFNSAIREFAEDRSFLPLRINNVSEQERSA